MAGDVERECSLHKKIIGGQLLFHYPPATTARGFNASDTTTPNDRLADCQAQEEAIS